MWKFFDLLVVLIIFERNTEGYQKKVFGGYTANEDEFTHNVGVAVSIFSSREVICSGSLVGTRLVITAAHCRDSFVYLGSVYILTGSKNIKKGGSWYYVSDVITHPQWVAGVLEYDVLLLKTKHPVKLIPNVVSLIKLPDKNSHIPKIDDKLWTCGWGLENPSGKRSTILKKIDLHVVPEELCNYVWGPNLEKRICLISKVKGWGTCNGDSGGGLVNQQGVLVGVLSYGTQDCDLNEPEVYSDVHPYLDWINSHMNNLKMIKKRKMLKNITK